MQTEIYVMKFDGDFFQNDYLKFFSGESRQQILSYKNNDDRLRSIGVQLLAKYFVAKKISQNFEKIVILRDEKGKPYIMNSDFQISLSHSRNWLVCSVGKAASGIDVEEDFEDALEISKNFFAPQEYFSLQNLHGDDLKKKFLSLWTLKESYGKFLGCGLTEKILNLDIEKFFAASSFVACRNFYLPDGAVIGICTAPDALPSDYFFVHANQIESL